MKNRYAAMLLSLLSLNAFVHADQGASDKEQSKEENFIQYNNRFFFSPYFLLGYERIKPNAIYVGLETFRINPFNQWNKNILADTEFRMGYNFFSKGKFHVTPFAGIGYLEKLRHSHHNAAILYGTIGFQYNHEYTSIFSMGVNFKVLIGGPLNERHEKWGSPVFGTYVSTPFTFRFNNKRHWDFRMEPFSLTLYGSERAESYIGFINTLGYRF